MALALYRKSKHSRLYRGVTSTGRKAAFSKSSIAPMHFESVTGSGEYDTAIDTTCVRTDTVALNGYEMTKAGFHFRIQTEVATGPQKPIGTVGFGGLKGKHWFHFKLIGMGYTHWPTRSWEDVGGAPDYSEEPIVQHSARNLGSHSEVEDEMVAANTLIQWGNLFNTPDGGEVYARWGVKQGKVKEEIIIDETARDWIEANSPASTPADETWFGFRFELDTAGVAKVFRNGVSYSFADDDFDDDEGNGLSLRNHLDELIAFMPLDEVYIERKGGRRPLRKRFYREQGKNYLVVGVNVEELQGLLDGDLIFDPTMSQEQIAIGTDDATGYTNYDTGGAKTEYPAILGYNGVTIGRYDYDYAPYLYTPQYGVMEYVAGFRFTPDVPANALFNDPTAPAAYATLRVYEDSTGFTSGRDMVAECLVDVASSNQPTFAADVVNNPAPPLTGGSNWTQGASVSSIPVDKEIAPNVQHPDIDVSAHMEEVCALSGWAPNNGMRFMLRRRDDGDLPLHGVSVDYSIMQLESYEGLSSKAAVLDAFYFLESDKIGLPPSSDTVYATGKENATIVYKMTNNAS